MEVRVLEYDRNGAGQPPHVFLPGGLTGWQSLLPLVPILSAERQLVRMQPIINAEGMVGRVGDGSYDAEVEQQSIGLTLEEAEVGDMHLIGWSNGARMALDFALAHPERVLTLTLVEPAAWWLVADRDETAAGLTSFATDCAGREIREDDVERFFRDVGFGGPDTDIRALPIWSLGLSGRQTLSWYDEGAVRTLVAGIEGFERLEVPTLLIRGRQTAPWLQSVVHVLAEGMPSTTVVELDGGHACILEHMEEFAAALANHVGGRGQFEEAPGRPDGGGGK
jgi:pimeloyl-ACP methyl ester carboxylesterase